MNKIFYVLIASGMVILIGTMLMYYLESGAENSKMKTIVDALWWCVATVTTVGYGDVVPVTKLGRIVAIVYMFFGITLIGIMFAVITNNFYKKRFEKEEKEKKEQETNYLRNLIINKLSDIEKRQSQCIDTINELRSSMGKSGIP